MSKLRVIHFETAAISIRLLRPTATCSQSTSSSSLGSRIMNSVLAFPLRLNNRLPSKLNHERIGLRVHSLSSPCIDIGLTWAYSSGKNTEILSVSTTYRGESRLEVRTWMRSHTYGRRCQLQLGVRTFSIRHRVWYTTICLNP